VEQLAAACDVSVDTVRYYQSLGLLPPPQREGRVGWYANEHADRIGEIRSLRRKGLTLAAIKRVVTGELGHADVDLAAAVAAAKKKRWPALVVTSDRDSFQLASKTVTILTPTRGVSELARIGPDEVRERYGVEPKQVPDFIALRGDPSDKLPGAPGVGPKRAAEIISQHGSLEAALKAGRFAPIAEELRLYRRIAALDASAPLPPLEDQSPLWAEASALLRRWGMNQMADRLAARAT